MKFLIQHGTLDPVTVQGKVLRPFARWYTFPRVVVEKVLRPILWREDRPRVPTVTQLFGLFRFDILWRGNPLVLGPKYGTTECLLCLKEETYIYFYRQQLQEFLVNSQVFSRFCVHKVLSGSPTLLTESGAEDAD